MNYLKHYTLLVERGQLRKKSKEVYYERHHIVPKCIGGSNEKSNLTLLTAREHYIAHVLLTKIYPKVVKISQALFCIMNIKPLTGQKSRHFEILRLEALYAYRGENGPRYGKRMSDELKLAQSIRMTGKYLGSKSPLYNKPKSDSEKIRIIMTKSGASEEYATKRIESLKLGRDNNPNFVDKYSAELKKERYRLEMEAHRLNGTKPFRKPMSEESKSKMGKWNIGKVRTEEFKETKRNLMKGEMNPMSNPEYRKKVAIAKTGLVASDETKAKISESKKGSRRVEVEPGIYKIIQAKNLYLYPGKYKP